MPPKPAAPAEAGSKQVKPKQKKAPAPKKTQPIKAKAVDYKSTIEAQWNTAASWRGKGHEEFDLQQVQKRAYFKGLQAPAVLSPLHHHHRRPRRQYHLPSADVWPTHVSCHCDSAYEFCEVLKPIRVSLMMLADTSCSASEALRSMAASMTTKERGSRSKRCAR